MQIHLNGNNHHINGEHSIGCLLKELGQDGKRVVVELNGIIIGNDKLDSTLLKDGDALEVIRLVGGG